MCIAVVGTGLAGTLLAWRLRRQRPAETVTVYSLPSAGGDATAASGGLVRGFEIQPETARVAAESLAELYAGEAWRETAGYREIGSVYVLNAGQEVGESLKIVEEWLPGSVNVVDRAALHRLGLHDLPPGTIGVQERRAGYLSPSRLRDAVLARLARDGVTICRTPVTSIAAGHGLTLADGRRPWHDAVVTAAGPWTPRLLGPAAGDFRAKQIQYAICLAGLPRIGAFVDETTGLYGRPLSPGIMLLGLPTDRWDVEPGEVAVDTALVTDLQQMVRTRFGEDVTPVRSVASSDCYTGSGGLALRQYGPGLFTFTGGSGGAAKTALAASRHAAAALAEALG